MAESPDEVYQRVLAEEQAKGSSPQVAEGRAKSARVRAQKAMTAGSAPAPEPPAQPAAEQPAPEQPAAEAPAAQPAAEQPAPAQPAASAAPPAAPGGEDPEAAYSRVLAEEQAKGSSPPVAEARAKAARMRARKAASGEAPAPVAPQPAAQQPAAQQAAQQPAAAAAPGPSAGGEDPEEAYKRVLAEEQAKGSSPPVAEARAKAARMRARKGAAAPAPQPAAAASAGAAPAAAAAAPAAAAAQGGRRAPARAAAAAAPEVTPERIQRLLAVVKPEAIQRVEKEPMDRVNVWPHLMAAEFLSLLAVTAFLVIFSTFINAPFRELANINVTPNPSKAPWYFLGLQELLRYFHPQVAGVTIPQWIILGLMAAPFIDRNPSNKPQDRKLAISLFTIFVLMFAVLGILGSLFRGPGFNFVYPWDAGIFFEL